MHNALMTDLAERLPATVASAPTLVDGIHRTLRDAIAHGRLPKGYRLREMPLADHFGCSTTPVREAIRKLEHEGLVKIYPRRGAEVTAFTTTEVADLYETRLVLECYAIRKGTELRPSASDLADTKALLKRQKDTVADGAGAPPLDAEFHQAITALAGNPVIAELVARATRQIEAVQSRSDAVVKGGRVAAHKAHDAILKAVARGDADRAERLMREHLEWARDAVMSSLDEAIQH